MSLTASSNVAVAGIFIGCPNCNRKVQIYHLNFSAMICQKCDTILHNPMETSNGKLCGSIFPEVA